MAKETIRIHGLRDLQRAFALASKEEAKGLKTTLAEAAKPVAATAESLVRSQITVGKIPWESMRIGVTQKRVYVAPKARRTVGTRRKNMAAILMDRGMLPALSSQVSQVEKSIDQMLLEVGRKWEHV